MASDVEVQNAAAIMTDDEEAVQNPKGESGDGEEIHGRDGFPMIEMCIRDSHITAQKD